MTSIVIPSSVEGIGWNAFSGCTNLASVTFADTSSNWWVTKEGASSSNVSSTLASNTPAQNAALLKTTHAAAYWTKHDTAPNTLAEIGVTVTSGQANHTTGTGTSNTIYFGEEDEEGMTVYSSPRRSIESVVIPYGVTTIATGSFAALMQADENEESGVSIDSDISSVYLPKSVATIGDYAFNGSTSLTSLTIPNSVISIGDYAFIMCTELATVSLSSSVTSIGDAAFAECFSLSGVLTLTGVISIGASSFCDTSITGVLFGNSLTTIGDEAFCGCESLEGPLTFPNSLTTIGGGAFYSCTSLTGTLTIPANPLLTTLPDETFKNCAFTSVVIGNNITSIGNNCFCACEDIESLTLGSNITNIGDWAFYGCSSIAGQLVLPSSITSIGELAFNNCSSITGQLVLPSGLIEIGEYAFANCSGLSGTLNIPNSVTNLGESAFAGCASITGLSIGSGLTSISLAAFYGTGITTVVVPDTVTEIAGSAFYYCRALTSVTIGTGVQSIGNYAFRECSLLVNLTINRATPPTLGSGAFELVSANFKIYVPSGSVTAYQSAWSDYSSKIEPIA